MEHTAAELHEVQQGTVPLTIWKWQEVGYTDEARKTVKNLFDGNSLFDTPKPDGEDLLLDFFAGSETTAHAVMAQNAEDGSNRKWICVQLPEATEENSEAHKAGLQNHC